MRWARRSSSRTFKAAGAEGSGAWPCPPPLPVRCPAAKRVSGGSAPHCLRSCRVLLSGPRLPLIVAEGFLTRHEQLQDYFSRTCVREKQRIQVRYCTGSEGSTDTVQIQY